MTIWLWNHVHTLAFSHQESGLHGFDWDNQENPSVRTALDLGEYKIGQNLVGKLQIDIKARDWNKSKQRPEVPDEH